MLELITDRTQQDVARLQALAQKGFANMTDTERAEWLAPSKGAYNVSDLNRVEEAVAYLHSRLNAYGYPVVIEPVRKWTANDVPTARDMARYIVNVKSIRKAFVTLPTTPAVPESMNGMTYAEANAIEQILTDVDRLLHNTITSFTHSGEFYGGEL